MMGITEAQLTTQVATLQSQGFGNDAIELVIGNEIAKRNGQFSLNDDELRTRLAGMGYTSMQPQAPAAPAAPAPTPAPAAPSGPVPVSAKLALQSDRLPMSRTDPAHTVHGLDIFPAIYLTVQTSDGVTDNGFSYKEANAQNVVFDDVSGDPYDLIKVVYWDVDANNPGLGKYAAQLTTTGNGVGNAMLLVSFKNAPGVRSSVPVTVVSNSN